MRATCITGLWILTLLCATAMAAQETRLGNGIVETINANNVTSIQLDGDGKLPADHVRIGSAGSVPADVDLIVVDPSSTFAFNEPVFMIDASLGALTLGSGSAESEGEDGEIFVEDGLGTTTFQVEGSTGNTTQILSGNGLIKAWAKINADGSVHSCWNCNSDPAETRSVPVGSGGPYEVDFTLGDISTRPYLVVVGSHTASSACSRPLVCDQFMDFIWPAIAPRFGDDSSVYVQLVDYAGGTPVFFGEEDFTVYIF